MDSWEEGPSGEGTFSKIKTLLADKRLVLVSNREPYIHKRSKRGITCERGGQGA